MPCAASNHQHLSVEIREGNFLSIRNLAACVRAGVSRSHFVCVLLQLSGQLVHLDSQMCLEAVAEVGLSHSSVKEVNSHSGGLFLRPCTHHPRQQWHFDHLVE